MGGVGLRRGRRNQNELEAGDSVDFWQYYLPIKKKKTLAICRKKVQAEAWLEFYTKKMANYIKKLLLDH